MKPRRSVRLSLESLDGRELPSATSVAPPITAAQTAILPVADGATRHYSHIRVAMLAYTGTPVGTVEQNLLRQSVDLVIPHIRYLDQFNALAPATPQMIYTNVSNIYEELLTDWLNYADRRMFDREARSITSRKRRRSRATAARRGR